MSREVGKVSLAILRGKSAGQSVPSFRFHSASDNITEVSDGDDDDDDSIGSLHRKGSFVSESEKESKSGCPDLHLESASSHSSFANQRSTSLDGGSSSADGSLFRSSVDSSIFSRLQRTLEEKMTGLRNEKLKEKEVKPEVVQDEQVSVTESDQQGSGAAKDAAVSSEKTVKEKKADFLLKQITGADAKLENASSPSKTKSTLVQEFTEHTSKLKSGINKSIAIRPKLSELRKRRASKDSLMGAARSQRSIISSIIGRDEVVTCQKLDEFEGIDAGKDAHEESIHFVREDDLALNSEVLPEASQPLPEQQPELDSNELVTEETQPSELSISLHVQDYVKFMLNNLSMLKCLGGLLFVCTVCPLPGFLSGFILGAGLTAAVFLWLYHLLHPPEDTVQSKESMPLYTLPAIKEDHCYEGWMNELPGEYTPETYHISLTHSIYIRLQGSSLIIDHPKKRINKHSRVNEDLDSGGFIHRREINLTGCQVVLLPKNLPRKWLWSRKYPICIYLKSASPETSEAPAFSPSSSSSPVQSPHSVRSCCSDLDGSFESTDNNWSLENNPPGALEEDFLGSLDDSNSFEEVTVDMCEEKTLYLFARTDREKDDWFRRFLAGTEYGCRKEKHMESIVLDAAKGADPSQMAARFDKEKAADARLAVEEEQGGESVEEKLAFDRFLGSIINKEGFAASSVSWFNALLGRLFFDFLRNPYWGNKIQERIQRKLSKVRLPNVIGELTVCSVSLGDSIPLLKEVRTPTVNERGLWVELSVEYCGGFRMSIETKLELLRGMRASSNPPSPSDSPSSTAATISETKLQTAYIHPMSSELYINKDVNFETDTDDSLESSSGDERDEEGFGDSTGGGNKPATKRLLKLVDTVANSRYFQQASESRIVKKAMLGVSNTKLELNVEVRKLSGLLVINVPPSPSDRIWYGFATTPQLVMVAVPRIGDVTVNLTPLVDLIQKQLKILFEKVFVLPNMDDLVIPIMSPLLPGQHQLPRPPWELYPTPSAHSSSTKICTVAGEPSASASASPLHTPTK